MCCLQKILSNEITICNMHLNLKRYSRCTISGLEFDRDVIHDILLTYVSKVKFYFYRSVHREFYFISQYVKFSKLKLNRWSKFPTYVYMCISLWKVKVWNGCHPPPSPTSLHSSIKQRHQIYTPFCTQQYLEIWFS